MLKIKLFSLVIIMFCTLNISFSQIESGKIVPKNQDKEKVQKQKKHPEVQNEELGTSLFFIGGGVMFSNPNNRNTSNLYSKPLGLEKSEMGMVVPYVGINYMVELKNRFYFSFGIDYSQSAEKFSYKSTTSDSAYQYKNKYQLVTLPLGINYISKGKIQAIVGVGIAPQLVFGSKHFLTVTSSDNKVTKTTTQLRDKMNDFNVLGFVRAGVQFELTKGFYCYVLPEFRYTFLNTLNKQAHYSRKYWQIGGQIGLSFNF